MESKKEVVLITGSMTAKEKRLAYEKVASHEADIIIGTHALIQERGRLDNLALVITDEQHRFGVAQREMFGSKGQLPHVLVEMRRQSRGPWRSSCTGISTSVIDELPANRLPDQNCVVDKATARAPTVLSKTR